jgi:hypothetical protein
MATNKLEHTKKELTLDIDAFNKPKELSEVKAWSQLMLDLVFMNPGTYPSLPNMGIGIGSYEFEFLDTVISELQSKIITQQQTYLPQIPLASLEVSAMDNSGQKVLIIRMQFNTPQGTENSAIAINTSQNNKFLDFEISWE